MVELVLANYFGHRKPGRSNLSYVKCVSQMRADWSRLTAPFYAPSPHTARKVARKYQATELS